jgi:AraC-like DNA-binding protein
LSGLPLDAHLETLRLLLDVLLLRLVHSPGRPPDAAAVARTDDTFRRFDAAVERGFTRQHRVGDYASALGYSVRTLTRAAQAATGSTAKQYIDARLLLEARRLLAYSELTSAEVARRLGFADPGDFGKFFRLHDGRTPLAFRAVSRRPASPAPASAPALSRPAVRFSP